MARMAARAAGSAGDNHLEDHLLSPFLDLTSVPPHVALIGAGGHTLLLDIEAYDKVGKMLGQPCLGRTEIEKAAREATCEPTLFPP